MYATLVRVLGRNGFKELQHANVQEVTIPEDGDTSDAIDMQGFVYCALEMPGDFDGDTINIEASNDYHLTDSPTWKSVYDDNGTEIGITVGTDRIVVLAHINEKIKDSNNLIGPLHYMRLKAGTTQTGERKIKVMLSR